MSRPTRPVRLGEQLVQAGLLTHEQLEGALGEQKAKNLRLGELLVEMGLDGEMYLLRIASVILRAAHCMTQTTRRLSGETDVESTAERKCDTNKEEKTQESLKPTLHFLKYPPQIRLLSLECKIIPMHHARHILLPMIKYYR